MAILLNAAAQLTHWPELLGSTINVALLGSLGDRFIVPPALSQVFRILSIDAVSPATGAGLISTNRLIAGTSGTRTFIRRKFEQCSSLCQPRAELIERYGLQAYFVEVERQPVPVRSLSEVLAEVGIQRLDLLKTDLEGLDFEVVQSLQDDLRHCQVLMMELRPEPFYVEEPPLDEVLSYLATQGFVLIDLKPERWRCMTTHWQSETFGQIAHLDATFVNRAPSPGDNQPLFRRALMLACLGYLTHAEAILEQLTPASEVEVTARAELIDFMFGQRGDAFVPAPAFPHLVP